jgi:hypothetical protein
MVEQTKIQFSYYLLKLWIDSTVTIILFTCAFLVLVFEKQPFGIILIIVIWLIGRYHFADTFRNLSRSLNKKPSIELTEEYIFDYINNKKIYWKNVKSVSKIHVKGNSYVVFDLIDKSLYYKQLKDPISKILFKLPDPDGISVKTEISLVQGKNENIYESIYTYHKKNRR